MWSNSRPFLERRFSRPLRILRFFRLMVLVFVACSLRLHASWPWNDKIQSYQSPRRSRQENSSETPRDLQSGFSDKMAFWSNFLCSEPSVYMRQGRGIQEPVESTQDCGGTERRRLQLVAVKKFLVSALHARVMMGAQLRLRRQVVALPHAKSS